MAEVAVAAPPADDEENYLYGENGDAAKKASDGTNSMEPGAPAAAVNSSDSQEPKKEDDDEEEEGEFEESDDDDDDNIQVHIGEVNASTAGPYGTPVNWKKDGGAAATSKIAALPTQGQKKIDVNAVGLINGQPIYEYDLDTEQDEKPWRKPGADISDYFNYGFNEDTWKQYCEKQRRMRMESHRSPYTVTQAANPGAQPHQVEIEVLPDGRTRVRAGPPPDRKVEGSIHVLGSNVDARRKQKEDELLALALGSTRVMPPAFPGQRPIYTGGVVPNGLQYLGPGPNIPGLQQIMPGTQIFPTAGPGMPGMEFAQQEHFVHPGSMLPPMGPGYGQYVQSDSDFDSDGENRKHRRRESKHSSRRHRDRSDRDRSDRDKDRDRDRSVRRDRERSVARRSRDHSKAPSDRKSSKHSSRSTSSIRIDDTESVDRKPSRSSRRSKVSAAAESSAAATVVPDDDVKKEAPIEVKQEPSGD